MHEKTIVTNPISDFSNVSKSNDDSSIDCAATTPMRSCTIEYQAGHRPLCMWILNTIVKGVLESYMYSFRVFFSNPKSSVFAVTLSYREHAPSLRWKFYMKTSLDDHDYEPGIIRSFCLGLSFTYTRMLEARDDGNTKRKEQRQSAKWASHNSQKPKTSSQSICASTPGYLLLWDICCIDIKKM